MGVAIKSRHFRLWPPESPQSAIGGATPGVLQKGYLLGGLKRDFADSMGVAAATA